MWQHEAWIWDNQRARPWNMLQMQSQRHHNRAHRIRKQWHWSAEMPWQTAKALKSRMEVLTHFCLKRHYLIIHITRTPDRAMPKTAESVVNMVEKASNPKNNVIAKTMPVAAPIWLKFQYKIVKVKWQEEEKQNTGFCKLLCTCRTLHTISRACL